MLADLEALRCWLKEAAITHVGMESTGVYWKPVWNVLEEQGFELILANPRQVKARGRRKSDPRDAKWLAEMLRLDQIEPSFVPSREQRDQRELTRYRRTLVHQRSDEVNRLQKTLEGANCKLAAVASDLQGVSARLILAALLEGQSSPQEMAELAKGKLRRKIPELTRALQTRFAPHQRFLVSLQLARIDTLDADIAAVEAQIEARMQPYAEQAARLDTLPGVGLTGAYELIAELGVDMSKFGSAQRCASWSKMAPGMNESAGKRHGSSTGKGNRWLRSTLIEAARAAAKTRTYLGSQYHRLLSRRGSKKAAVAVGHTILTIAYHILSTPGLVYHDLGYDYFDQRRRQRLTHSLVRRLQALGFYVTLDPVHP
jgi:transposase